jgi:hypothetical protein
VESTSLELRGLRNFAAEFATSARQVREDRRRRQTVRQTRKPHIYTEDGLRLVVERTAPGEWWVSPFEGGMDGR